MLGIPKFIFSISQDMTFCCYSEGSSTSIPTLSRNKILYCRHKSTLQEIVRYLSLMESNHKSEILMEQHSVTKLNSGNKKLYSVEMIARAFGYYSISRSLYSRLLKDFQLPSIRILQRLSSRCNSLEDEKFLKSVFDNLEPRKKRCIIELDEMYVKKVMSYHAGNIYGKAVDDDSKLAKTILAVLIKCQFGGPIFIYKAFPVNCLKSDFLREVTLKTIDDINKQEGQVTAIITDGHKVNQKFFDSLKESEAEPWKMKESNTFLLYDYVHVAKSVRNNWLTEKTKQLEYYFDGERRVAKWSDLVDLYNIEGASLLKLSKLNFVSVFPKPIERQSVKTCLRIFCDETVSALATHPKIDHEAVSGTRIFIQIFLDLWKIFDVRVIGEDRAQNDSLRAVFKSQDDPRFEFLKEVSRMAFEMKPTCNPRQKSLTHDTSKFLVHNISGFREMTIHLLVKGDEYVMFGSYTTDNVEKKFGQMRQGTGGALFLTVQSSLEKICINKARVCLRLDVDLREVGTEQHKCNKCKEEVNEKEREIIESLEHLEPSLEEETFAAIIHIAGYLQKKCGLAKEEDTSFYLEKYGKYLKSLDRGRLTKPLDSLVQWTVFCYIFFIQTNNLACRKNMIRRFSLISEQYEFNVSDSHCKTLCNILINNYVHLNTPKSNKETDFKRIKLSEN